MTVDTNAPIAIGTGNAATTHWPFEFKIDRPEDLLVVLTDPGGENTVLTDGIDYYVSGDFPGPGSVTYPVSGDLPALPLDWKITRLRRSVIDQQIKIRRGGDFSGPVIETVLDRVVMALQEHEQALGQSLKLADQVEGVDTILPNPEPGKTFRWNATGDGLEPADDPGDAAINAAASQSAAINASNAAAASATTASTSADDAATSADAAALSQDSAANSASAARAAALSGMFGNIQIIAAADSPLFLEEANDGELIQFNTAAGNITVNLPDSTSVITEVRFGCVKITDDANTVTFNPAGTDTIIGGSPFTIDTLFTTIVFVLDKASGAWMVLDVNAALVSNTTHGVVGEATIKGRADGTGTGHPQDLTASQARLLLGLENVKDYGAMGDGISDDTTFIQAAIDAVSAAGGGVVLLPAGTYLVGDTAANGYALGMKTGVRLVGEGSSATVIKLKDDEDDTTVIELLADQADIAVRSITIDGNRTNQSSPTGHLHGIAGNNGCNRIRLDDIHIRNVHGYSIFTNRGDGAVRAQKFAIRDIDVESAIQDCIRISQSDYVFVADCTLETDALSGAVSGVEIASSKYITIRGVAVNHLNSAIGFGILVAGGGDTVSVVGGFSRGGMRGIGLLDCQNVSVTGMTIDSPSSDGCWIQHLDALGAGIGPTVNIKIMDCIFINPNNEGIVVAVTPPNGLACDRITLTNNIFYDDGSNVMDRAILLSAGTGAIDCQKFGNRVTNPQVVEYVGSFSPTHIGEVEGANLGGTELFLDADGDTSLRAEIDDVVALKSNGVDIVEISDAEGVRIVDHNIALDRATGTPQMELYRSESGIGDTTFIRSFRDNAAGTKTEYGRIELNVEADTASNEDAILRFMARRAGTLDLRLLIGAGLYHQSAAGGDKGANTINFGAVYDDDALLSCYPLHAALDGKIDVGFWDSKVPDEITPAVEAIQVPVFETVVEDSIEVVVDDDVAIERPVKKLTKRRKFEIVPVVDEVGQIVLDRHGEPRIHRQPVMRTASGAPEKVEPRLHQPARRFANRNLEDLDPGKYWDFVVRHRHLPCMPDEKEFDPVADKLSHGDWIQRLVETVEVQAVHIHKLDERLKTVERPPKSGGEVLTG